QTSETNEYVQVANLVVLGGTLGHPDADLDKKGAAVQVLEQVEKRIGDENVQKVLKGVGGLLGGRQGATNALPGTNINSGTNTQSTNRKDPFNPLDILKPKK